MPVTKTILIPTDFTLASLEIVRQAARHFSAERIRVVLFHALHTPTDIQDLLSISSRVPHEKITDDFRQVCAAIKKKNSEVIASISFQYLYGNTAGVFRNFLEAHRIDCIFYPAHLQLKQAYPNSVDVRPLIRHVPVAVITNILPAVPNAAQPFSFQNPVLSEG